MPALWPTLPQPALPLQVYHVPFLAAPLSLNASTHRCDLPAARETAPWVRFRTRLSPLAVGTVRAPGAFSCRRRRALRSGCPAASPIADAARAVGPQRVHPSRSPNSVSLPRARRRHAAQLISYCTFEQSRGKWTSRRRGPFSKGVLDGVIELSCSWPNMRERTAPTSMRQGTSPRANRSCEFFLVWRHAVSQRVTVRFRAIQSAPIRHSR